MAAEEEGVQAVVTEEEGVQVMVTAVAAMVRAAADSVEAVLAAAVGWGG